MLTVANEFRVGRPQMIAGLLLLAFFCQCLWVAQTRHLSDVEFSYLAATHASRQGEQSPITSPFTVLAASLPLDRKSTRLNSSHSSISYAVFCLKKKKNNNKIRDKQTKLKINTSKK